MTQNFPVLNSCHCFVFGIFRGCNIYVPKVSKELNESLVHRNIVNKHTSQTRRQCSLFINSMKKSVVLHAKFFRAKFLFHKKFFNFNKNFSNLFRNRQFFLLNIIFVQTPDPRRWGKLCDLSFSLCRDVESIVQSLRKDSNNVS